MSSTLTVQEARAQLDSHTRELINWHFSPETGCPYWLDWAKNAGWDPREKVECFADMAPTPKQTANPKPPINFR